MDFDTSYETSFASTMRYLRRASRFLKVLKVLGTVAGASLIALSPWVGTKGFASAAALSDWMLWIGIIVTVFSSLVLIFVDDTTPDVLAENLALARELEVDEERFEYLLEYIDHTLARVSLNSYLREIVESAVTDGCTSIGDLCGYSKTVLALLDARKASLFNIQDEQWNFAVYRYSADEEKLICLACKRAFEDPPDHQHRAWKVGEGHVGLAFSRATELIFADATTEELRPVIGATGENERSYDSERYRSLAAMPISQDGVEPLGILIATSSIEGRFKSELEREEQDWEREDVLREVAAYLAILFKLIHSEAEQGESHHDAQQDNG